jgi:uncharacterized membrane protein YbhN (UPF0104 family)
VKFYIRKILKKLHVGLITKILTIISFLIILNLLRNYSNFTLLKLENKGNFVFAIFCLLCAFTISSLGWRAILIQNCDRKISFKAAYISQGLSVFAKYIPGKVMIIFGRANFISNFYNINIVQSTYLSTLLQLIMLIIGMCIGSCYYFYHLEQLKLEQYIFYFLFLLLIIVQFSTNILGRLIIWIYSRKKKKIPINQDVKLSRSLLFTISSWFFYSIGFCILFLSVNIIPTKEVFFIFPLAMTLSWIAIFVPGGIGVREGILVLLLTKSGFNQNLAINLALLARIWFFICEMLFFLSAFALNLFSKEKSYLLRGESKIE